MTIYLIYYTRLHVTNAAIHIGSPHISSNSVTVSLQAPDGDYEITIATAKLKRVNQKDLFVTACWLWDIGTAKKLTRLEESIAAELDGVQK